MLEVVGQKQLENAAHVILALKLDTTETTNFSDKQQIPRSDTQFTCTTNPCEHSPAFACPLVLALK